MARRHWKAANSTQTRGDAICTYYSHTELYKAVVWDDFLQAERKVPVAKINIIGGESDTK